MEEKKPFVKEVRIDGETYPMYNVTIKGIPMVIASPALAYKIDKCIQDDQYLNPIGEMDGKQCTIKDIDETFTYIFGDDENLNPTENEVIESVEDVMEIEEYQQREATFQRAVSKGNRQVLFLNPQDDKVHSLLEMEPGSNKFIDVEDKTIVPDEQMNSWINIDDRVTNVHYLKRPVTSFRCMINGEQQMAVKLDRTSAYVVNRLLGLHAPQSYIQGFLRLKAAETYLDLLKGPTQERSKGLGL